MAEKLNKNQTALDRAEQRKVQSGLPSRHFCDSPKCPRKHIAIPLGELVTVVVLPKKGKRHYHKSCQGHA